MAETNFAPNLGEVFEIPPVVAGSSGSSGSGATEVYIDNYGGGAPSPSPAGDAIAVDSSTDAIWYFTGGSWTQVTAGGTTIQYSASSDPSGTPTGNARVWIRLDTGQIWVFNTGTAAWELYLG